MTSPTQPEGPPPFSAKIAGRRADRNECDIAPSVLQYIKGHPHNIGR